MTFDPEKYEHRSKEKLAPARRWTSPRRGSAEPAPLAPSEQESEALLRAKELQEYRVVLRCRTRPAED